MRKQTKLVAVLSAAALLAIGASMTSFAAAGWTEDNGTWVWLDNDGDRVYEEWKKSGNNYFWLDDNGEMATNTIVEDEDGKIYYVDENGARVTNRWVSVDNEDSEEVGGNDVSVLWYRFGADGKALKAGDNDGATKVTTIEGKKYVFNENGHMLSGWQNLEEGDSSDGLYYLGDENEGWAYTGWQYLEVDDEIHNQADGAGDYDTEWFNFKSSGKARVDTTYYAGGAYYTFNEDGVMLDNWYETSTPPDAASGAQAYVDATGAVGSGWVYTTPPGDDSADAKWYYLITVREGNDVVRGIPFNYNNDGYAARYIKNKTYLFDGKGRMHTGIINIGYEEDESDEKFAKATPANAKKLDAGIYYFNEASGSVQGQMATGKTTIEKDGEFFYYYFQGSGAAYTNILKDGCIYGADGKRLNAEDGSTYEVKDVEGLNIVGLDSEVTTVIVGKTGKVKKSGTVKIDGDTWEIGSTADLKDYQAQLRVPTN